MKELKEWLDQKDPFLIYEVNENEHYVFKSSKKKLELAKEMSVVAVFQEEHCHFDGKSL